MTVLSVFRRTAWITHVLTQRHTFLVQRGAVRISLLVNNCCLHCAWNRWYFINQLYFLLYLYDICAFCCTFTPELLNYDSTCNQRCRYCNLWERRRLRLGRICGHEARLPRAPAGPCRPPALDVCGCRKEQHEAYAALAWHPLRTWMVSTGRAMQSCSQQPTDNIS